MVVPKYWWCQMSAGPRCGPSSVRLKSTTTYQESACAKQYCQSTVQKTDTPGRSASQDEQGNNHLLTATKYRIQS